MTRFNLTHIDNDGRHRRIDAEFYSYKDAIEHRAGIIKCNSFYQTGRIQITHQMITVVHRGRR